MKTSITNVYCGVRGIRTPDALLTHTRFPGVPLQPLEHHSFVFGLVGTAHKDTNLPLNDKIWYHKIVLQNSCAAFVQHMSSACRLVAGCDYMLLWPLYGNALQEMHEQCADGGIYYHAYDVVCDTYERARGKSRVNLQFLECQRHQSAEY